MERYVCIHGHFYQPPRENPWLEAVDLQDTAYPYHDWNERITAECYGPNAQSRILDDRERIVQMVNNYARISFNFGPTLLAWMEKKSPDVYQAVLDADRESMDYFSGHGSALAQAYNHMIMPLANARDKKTQVLWGIRDFEYRFGRHPEGMWLPETAVDLETLDLLAQNEIRFTILSQHQARRVRPLKEKAWQDVTGGKIDPTTAYSLRLPSGRRISLFFYDGNISKAVAFERLLSSGESFAQRLMGGFSEVRAWPQLVHIATDGESYGHHHRFGDMGLAYAIRTIESRKLARFTNYGEYLEKYPPAYEVEISENTSWSCAHGVGRWQEDCGCSTAGRPGWNQKWRRPLRNALNQLRDSLVPLYEKGAGPILKDAWAARDAYIHVVLERSQERIDGLFKTHSSRSLTQEEKALTLRLLELQRHSMLMFTSCGWFFDDPSGIETIQILQYAGRAMQLAQEIFGEALEPSFLEVMKEAKSNLPAYGDGRQIYEKFVRQAQADLRKVCAHYAMSSLFKEYGKTSELYCYTVEQEDYRPSQAGKATLVMGRGRFTSRITMETALLSFGVLHLGDHNMSCGVREDQEGEKYEAMVKEITSVFERADFPDTIRSLDRHFGSSTYSLKSLFQDEQRKILSLILESALEDAEAVYRQIYENNAPMIRFLKDAGNPLPKAISTAAEFVVNADLQRAFTMKELRRERIQDLLEEAGLFSLSLQTESLEYALRKNMEEMADELASTPTDLSLLEGLEKAFDVVDILPFRTNLWSVQNVFYQVLKSNYPDQRRRAGRGDKNAKEWTSRFVAACTRIYVKVG